MNATEAVARLSEVVDSLAAQGFDTRPLVVDSPASPGEVDAVEGSTGVQAADVVVALPDDRRQPDGGARFCRCSRDVAGRWGSVGAASISQGIERQCRPGAPKFANIDTR
ncbi:hypothetical protein [Micromonospora kangleipakensis]|uniref:hypothetical protein n=1 Tax=Micromonospora kangleipakensis TaxID=1077942 RepID=UPI0010293DC4|nr:hypothetical protein [Micromonospora kangleipakensis]